MADNRKTSGTAFWATFVAAVLFAYPLAFGPACWISSRIGRGQNQVSMVYQPILRTWAKGPKAVAVPSQWYATLFSRVGWNVGCYRDSSKYRWGHWLPGTEVSVFPNDDGVIEVGVEAEQTEYFDDDPS